MLASKKMQQMSSSFTCDTAAYRRQISAEKLAFKYLLADDAFNAAIVALRIGNRKALATAELPQ